MTDVASPREALLRDMSAAVARAEERIARARSLILDAGLLCDAAWRTRLRVRATYDHSCGLRLRRELTETARVEPAPVQWFTVDGSIAGKPVWARWDNGELTGDPRLIANAELLVQLGVVFEHDDPPAVVAATLSGHPAAVMLTLAKACDSVRAVNFDTTRHDASPLDTAAP
jgi:hypothetical protein